MKLCEHPDFEQAVLGAAQHFAAQGMRPPFIEKDYYVTEALRAIAAGDKVIFKGGTSLSKGWNLIQRFSEDIDLFLDPAAFQPPLGKRAIDRELKALRDVVARHPALAFVEAESRTIGGFGRADRFSYTQRFGGPGEVANRVLLEAGTASGREPTTVVELRSYVGQFLAETGVTLGAEDEGAFPMRLLHFRRTFVEKMFAIHAKVELLKRDGQAIGTYARHYYDLYQLAQHPEVLGMLRSAEYAAIKADYDQISRSFFARSYFFPEAMSFARSDALFPPAGLAKTIEAEYQTQCSMLCYGKHPTWTEVQRALEGMRELLLASGRRPVHGMGALTPEDSQRWNAAIQAWLTALETDGREDSDVVPFRDYLDALREMLQRMATEIAPRDTWEASWACSVVFIRSAKLAQNFSFQFDDLYGRYSLACSPAYCQHLSKMPDPFWRLLLDIHELGTFELVSDDAKDKPNHVLWGLVREHVRTSQEAAERAADGSISCGRLQISWPAGTPLKDVFELGTEAFRRLYRLRRYPETMGVA